MSGDKMSEGKILEGKMSGGVNCPFTYVCQPSKKQKNILQEIEIRTGTQKTYV